MFGFRVVGLRVRFQYSLVPESWKFKALKPGPSQGTLGVM